MAVKLSTELRNRILEESGLRNLLRGGIIHLYSGSQPAGTDLVETGTLLAKITLASATYTGATAAAGTVQLSAGTSGSVDTLKIGGGVPLIGSAVAFNTDLSTTATDLATAINAYANALGITAAASTDTVTITAPLWMGADANGLSVASTATTITTVDTAFASGVDATAGLAMAVSAVSGVLSKDSGVWSGDGIAAGTAGWFRWYDADYVTGADTTSCRLDGSAGISGTQLVMSSTTVQVGVAVTVDSMTVTEPAS